MQIWISVGGAGDPVAELESLIDFLRGEPRLAGRVRRRPVRPGPGEMGALSDMLIVSGASLPVLGTALRAWLIHRRRSGLAVKVHGPDGRILEIDAKNISNRSVEEILRQALRADGEPGAPGVRGGDQG